MLLMSASFVQAQKVMIGNYVFPKDGSTYYGELEGGKPNGKGKCGIETQKLVRGKKERKEGDNLFVFLSPRFEDILSDVPVCS